MDNYSNLLELRRASKDLTELQTNRLTRLISGYHAVQLFFSNMVDDKTVVGDVGCYFGQWSYPLLSNVKKVLFIDYIDTLFPYLRQLIGNNQNANLVKHNFIDSPLADTEIDIMLCMGTFNYIKSHDLERFCKNMASNLKSGGYLVFDLQKQLHTFFRYELILKPVPLLYWIYPDLRKITSGKVKWKEVGRLIFMGLKNNFIHVLGNIHRILFSRFGLSIFSKALISKISSDRYERNIETVKDIFNKEGLVEVELSELIDPKLFDIIRNMEDYNLNNTFVGNWLSLHIFQKK